MSLKNEIPEESKMSAEKILLESKIPVESEKLSKSDKSAELERPVGSKKSVESRKAAESKKSYIFVLAGNPNSGKTTLFNELTGSTQYVGNWPGVTVEKKEGRLRKSKENVTVVDLPGIYSLSPYSLEEVIARDYITENKPDVVVNIVDASNIERNLYLTTQLLELGTPVVVAMNMMDVVRNRNDSIDIKKMEKLLGVPVAPVSAIRGEGVDEVISKALSAVISGSMKTTEGTTAESTVDTTAGATMSTTAELTANTAAGATANTTTGSTASTTAGVIMDTIAELSANTTAGAAGAARGIRFDDRIEKCIDKVIRTLVSLKKEYIYDVQGNVQGNAQGNEQRNDQENEQENEQGNAQGNAQGNEQGNEQGISKEMSKVMSKGMSKE
jgi:small GTP-binding protein